MKTQFRTADREEMGLGIPGGRSSPEKISAKGGGGGSPAGLFGPGLVAVAYWRCRGSGWSVVWWSREERPRLVAVRVTTQYIYIRLV